MQPLSSAANLRSRQTLDEPRQASLNSSGKSAEKSRPPQISAPATRLPRSTITEPSRGLGLAVIQRNQVVEALRPNEDPSAILSHLSGDRPTLKQSATEYANEYLNAPKRKHWMAPRVKEPLDVNELVLVDFGPPKSQPRSANRFTPLQYDPASITVTPLAELFIANYYDSDQFDPDLRHNGVYKKSDLSKPSFVTETSARYTANAKKRGKQVDPNVAMTALSLERLDAAMKGIANDARAGASNQFLNYHEQRLNDFFHKNMTLYAQARRDQTINNINQAAQRRTCIAGNSLQAQVDEPRFDHADEKMIISALNGSIKGTVKVYPLRIGQHDSINAQRFTDHTGRTVLHMPGEKWPLRGFDNLVEAQIWLADSLRAGGEHRVRKFAQQHFSRNGFTNRTEGPQPSVLDRINSADKNELLGMETALPMSGDPFQVQAAILRQKTIEDDKYDVSVAYTTADQQYIETQNSMPLAGDIASGAQKTATSVQPHTSTIERVIQNKAGEKRSGIANLSGDELKALMRRRTMLGVTRQRLHNVTPNLAMEATQHLKQILESRFNIYTDPNELNFSTYEPLYYDQFVASGYAPIENLRAYQLKETIPLTELVIHSPPYAPSLSMKKDAGDPKGLYLITKKDAVPKKFVSTDQSLISVPKFVKEIRESSSPDLTQRYRNSIKNYYKTYGDSVARYSAQHAMFVADVMLARGTLSRDDYDIAITAFAQAKPSQSTDIEVRVLTLNGHGSLDSLDIYKPATGRTLLYMPGEDPEIKAFPSRSAAIGWLQGIGRQGKAELDRFVNAHFSITLGQAEKVGPFGTEGVKEFLLQAVKGPIARYRSVLGSAMTSVDYPSGTKPENYLNGIVLHSSPFLKLNQLAEKGALSDAKLFIDSDADERKRWWAQAFEFVPFAGGINKMALAKTQTEFDGGLSSFGLDLLMGAVPEDEILRYLSFAASDTVGHAAVKLVGGKSATVKNSAIEKFDSFFKPPVLIEGRPGYLLSPNAAMHLPEESPAKYFVNAESRADLDALDAGEYSDLSPFMRNKLASLQKTLIADAEMSFTLRSQVLEKSGHPDVVLPQGKTKLKDAIADLFNDKKYTGSELGRSIVLNENHKQLAARKAIYDSMVAMKNSNIKTLFVEWALHEENQKAFDLYFKTGSVNDVLQKTLDDADSVVKFGPGENRYAMEELLANARAQGIRIVGLDSHTARSFPGPLSSAERAVDNRQIGFNYYAEQVIREHQAANGNQPFAVWVGYKHGVEAPRFFDKSKPKIPGLGQLLDTISIYIAEPVKVDPWLQHQVVLDPMLELSMNGRLELPPPSAPEGYRGRVLTS